MIAKLAAGNVTQPLSCFLRLEEVPQEESLQDDEPLLTASSANDSAIAMDSDGPTRNSAGLPQMTLTTGAGSNLNQVDSVQQASTGQEMERNVSKSARSNGG